MKKTSTVNQIEVAATGNVGIRISLNVIDDDGTTLATNFHRTAIPQGANPEEVMVTTNAAIEAMGYPPLSEADVKRVLRIVEAAND